MGKSGTSGIQQDNDFMMFPVWNRAVPLVNRTATAVYRPISREMTWSVRKSTCVPDIRNMRFYRISEVDSISDGRILSSFWNRRCLEMSEKLWSPIGIDYAGLDSICSNGSLKNTMSESWFSTRLLVPHNPSLSQTCSRLSRYFHVGFMDSENILIKSRKIRFYPNKEQKKILFRWFGTARYTYNQTVSRLKQPDTKASWIAIKTGIIKELPEWSYEVPYQIKSIAVKDACKAVSNSKMKFKKTGVFSKVKFRSRKRGDYNIFVPKSAVRPDGFYITLLGKLNIREKIKEIKYDCRVKLENDRYFLILPEEARIRRPESQRLPACALDPGVRTFQTLFSEKIAMKIAEHDFNRIYRLCYILDKLYSRRKRENTNRFNRKLKRIRWKIKDLISEIHHKLALFLVRTFDRIYIPTFETSRIVTKLHSKVSRAMLTWSHYRFKEFLKLKGREYSCDVIEVDESYTSKTCGVCGKLNSVGSKEHWKCCYCGSEHDRDLNGARNIFIKSMLLA